MSREREGGGEEREEREERREGARVVAARYLQKGSRKMRMRSKKSRMYLIAGTSSLCVMKRRAVCNSNKARRTESAGFEHRLQYSVVAWLRSGTKVRSGITQPRIVLGPASWWLFLRSGAV